MESLLDYFLARRPPPGTGWKRAVEEGRTQLQLLAAIVSGCIVCRGTGASDAGGEG